MNLDNKDHFYSERTMAKNVMTKGQKESHKAMKLSLFPGFMFLDEFQPHICFYFLPSKRAETKGGPKVA